MSEVIKAEVVVSKEAYELGICLAKLVKEGKKILADGVSAADIPAILATLMLPEVVNGIQGLEKLGDELKADKAAFIAAFVVAASKVVE